MPTRTLVFVATALVLLTLHARQQPRPASEPVDREEDVVLPATEPASPALPAPAPIPPPSLSEVHKALDGVFGTILTVDLAARPAFVAGDFNGDDAADLAVSVRPRGRDSLPGLNAELTPWGLQDATAPPMDAASGPERPKVAAGDRLLAVVHGVGAEGWRHADSRQGYLVKNAIGGRMQPQPLAGTPSAVRMRAIRLHTGDVIATDRGGKPGLVFWTGATYTWTTGEPGPGEANP